MEQAEDNGNPLLDQLDLEFADERATIRDEEADREAQLEREHFEFLHDYENPNSGFAYDYVQHTAPIAPAAGATVSGSAPSAGGYKFKWIVDVKHEQVPWLWPGRIPFGTLTILDGDPGIGKTTIVLDLMARLSSGRPMPFTDQPLQEMNSLVVSVEDSVAFTIAPRLRVAGADESRVAVLIDFPLFPSGLEKLKKTVKETRSRIVMVDPGLAMFDVGINSSQDAETRRVVGGLAALAADCEAAVIFVRHLTKGQRDQAMYRGGGSIAISAAARSCLLAKFPRKKAEHPVLASYKSSLSLIPPTLSYKIVGAGEASRIEWLEEISMTADEALEGDLPQQWGGGGSRSDGASAGLKKQLLKALKDSGTSGSTLGDLTKAVKRGRDAVRDALDELVASSHARFEEERSGGKGRPRGIYRIGDENLDPLNDSPPEGPQEDFGD